MVLIESGGTDEVGRHIAAAVRRITTKPMTHVINTHHHGDHHLGNVAFAGATFISAEKCRDMVLKGGQQWVKFMEKNVRREFRVLGSLSQTSHTKREPRPLSF